MISNYNHYLNLVKEGLIRTHNILKYETSLRLQLDASRFEYKLNIENKLLFSIEFFNVNKLNQLQLDVILPIVNNFGYYPSYIYLELPNGMVNDDKFDVKYLTNIYKSFKIIFEAKYTDGLYSNDLIPPDIVYHLTRQINEKSIKINGLYLKSYNKKTNHPDRIYLFKSIDNYISLLNKLKLSDFLNKKIKDKNEKNNDNGKYMLLEIKLPKDIIIHSDPHYMDGFYTTDNIPFKYINIIKNNL